MDDCGLHSILIFFGYRIWASLQMFLRGCTALHRRGKRKLKEDRSRLASFSSGITYHHGSNGFRCEFSK